MRVEIPSESVEDVDFGVAMESDPTTGTCEIGFGPGPAAPTTWVAGTWAGSRTVWIEEEWRAGWVARFRFGTGQLDLVEGTYEPWLRVTVGGQQVVRKLDDTVVVT